MRILYIAHSHPPDHDPMEHIGGMQSMSLNLLRELEKQPDVELVTLINTTYHTLFLPLRVSLFLLRLFYLMPKMIKKHKPDVVLFSSMVTASTLSVVPVKPEVKFVAINHGQDVTLPNRMFQRLIPKIYKNLDAVISVSRATKKEASSRGMPSSRISVIPNGSGLKKPGKFPGKDEAKRYFEKKLNRKFNDKKVLLTVGRHIKRKGHCWFIGNVLPMIQTGCIYLVIGEGPETENIRKTVEGKGFNEKVYLLGPLTERELKYAYSFADLFIMPNIPVKGDMEGFGIVIPEANQAGLPVIASDLEGIMDAVKNGKNGYRIEPLQPELFSRKIDRVLKSKEYEYLSESAREFAARNFSWDVVAQEYVSTLKQITRDEVQNVINTLHA